MKSPPNLNRSILNVPDLLKPKLTHSNFLFLLSVLSIFEWFCFSASMDFDYMFSHYNSEEILNSFWITELYNGANYVKQWVKLLPVSEWVQVPSAAFLIQFPNNTLGTAATLWTTSWHIWPWFHWEQTLWAIKGISAPCVFWPLHSKLLGKELQNILNYRSLCRKPR